MFQVTLKITRNLPMRQMRKAELMINPGTPWLDRLHLKVGLPTWLALTLGQWTELLSFKGVHTKTWID